MELKLNHVPATITQGEPDYYLIFGQEGEVGMFEPKEVTPQLLEKATLIEPLYRRPPSMYPIHPDDMAVDDFATKLKVKLARSRAKGRRGWQDPGWTPSLISAQLREHVEKGDPLDVANFCMFLAARQASITPATQAKVLPDYFECRDYARKILMQLGQNCSSSNEPGADPRLDMLTNMIERMVSEGKLTKASWIDRHPDRHVDAAELINQLSKERDAFRRELLDRQGRLAELQRQVSTERSEKDRLRSLLEKDSIKRVANFANKPSQVIEKKSITNNGWPSIKRLSPKPK